MALSQKLKELRKKQGLTQIELAEKLFVSRQAITGWEAGTSRPSTGNLQSLGKLFNVPLEMLLDDTVEVEHAPEKISDVERLEEENREQETEKAGRHKIVILVIAFLLVLLTVAVLTHRATNQEDSEDLDFSMMKDEVWDTTEDDIEYGTLGRFDEGR